MRLAHFIERELKLTHLPKIKAARKGQNPKPFPRQSCEVVEPSLSLTLMNGGCLDEVSRFQAFVLTSDSCLGVRC